MPDLVLILRRNKPLLLIPIFVFVILFFYSFNSAVDPQKVYPFQQSYHQYNAYSDTYKIAIVADLDKDSKVVSPGGQEWKSIIRYGVLKRDEAGMYSIRWTGEKNLVSKLNEGGRGMELSELCYFNNMLLTFDDRTGLVFEVIDDMVIPRYILADGDGKNTKGFKAEWCTVKDDKLYIGGMGKEWTTSRGELVNYDPMWVKSIDLNGKIEHHNWIENYNRLRQRVGASWPGYLLHESAAYSKGSMVYAPDATTTGTSQGHWLFLPRRLSKELYDADLDEYRCHNTGLLASPSLQQVEVLSNVGPLVKTRGFSSVKFIPFRENEFVVLKTEEAEGVVTYMAVYDLSGKVLMPEVRLDSMKFEGLEFVF